MPLDSDGKAFGDDVDFLETWEVRVYHKTNSG